MLQEREDAARIFGATADTAAGAVGAQQKQPRQFDPDQDLAQAEKRQKQQVQHLTSVSLVMGQVSNPG